jgi:hypothetical protein
MRIVSSFILAAAIGLSASVALAQDHAHHPVPDAQVTAPAEPYASDAPLRKGMGEIRTAVAAFDHYEHGHMNEDQAMATVAIIERAIGDIIVNCKLEPEADHALHGVLAKLGKGIAGLKADPNDMTALAPMREAVADYSVLFDDPAADAD